MKKVISVAVASVLFGSVGASARVSDAEWEQLKSQFTTMNERMNALEVENAHLREVSAARTLITVEDLDATNAEVATLKAQNKSTSWAESVKWKGDFRYRYEEIDEDHKDDRDRNRIRARAHLVADLPEDVEVGLGLATGGDDPVSTNQTLGGGGSTKDLRLDLAYAKWDFMEDFYLVGGKYKNPFYRVQKSSLIWDGDFRPEGVAGGWRNDMFFATVEGNWIESDSKKNDDYAWGVQGGMTFALFGANLTTAVKYFEIPTKDRESIFDDDFFGNSTVIKDGVEVYEYDYNMFNASLDVSFNLFDMPLSVYGDYVKNDDADDYDTGYIAGLKLGKAKNKGSWQLQYQYEKLEANAVLGLFTDSDFAGGGTDGKGHKFSGKYAITSKWALALTYFDTDRGVDLGSDASYKRLMVDTVFKY